MRAAILFIIILIVILIFQWTSGVRVRVRVRLRISRNALIQRQCTPTLSLGEILIGERGRPARSSARPRAEHRAVTANGPIPCPRPSEPTARAPLAAPEAGALPILILGGRENCPPSFGHTRAGAGQATVA